jgi:tRNA-specific 2-thiouridylase
LWNNSLLHLAWINTTVPATPNNPASFKRIDEHASVSGQSLENVVVGVSGGVDSAVALKRMLDTGVSVQAVFMKNWDEDDAHEFCSAEQDLADARAVCERLGVPLLTVNFSFEYWERVFEDFLAEHRRGRTPNPDVMCNQVLKFDAFLDYARDLGATHIATGHYARIDQHDSRFRLLRARDENKDQTYFLHRLDQQQLASARFPLGELDKPAVRELARYSQLPVHDKKDSTGLCFIGERPFAEFLARFVEPDPGPIRTPQGETVGEHRGLAFYTIGQRQGLGIGGRADAAQLPWYVVDKQMQDNVLVVVQGGNHPALFSTELLADSVHWIAGSAPELPLRCEARIRHRQQLQACTVFACDTDSPQQDPTAQTLRVCFEDPQRAVAPGQSVVFYVDEECLGGAIIQSALRPDMTAPHPAGTAC